MKLYTKILSLKFFLIFLAVIVAVLIGFFCVSKFFPTSEGQYIKDINKLISPYRASDLNILIITLDTTRADHLGCYGYSGVRTPNMDRLAEEGILFKNATCQTPLTLPSHASIFTGTYPFFHGVKDNGFYLEDNRITLAEVVKEHGWTTSAFIGAFVLDSRWGLDQGFDYYYDNFDFTKYKTISLDSVQREGGKVTEAFFDWLEKNHQQKFLSWIHLYDPHTPYDPPEPYKTQYSNSYWTLYDGEIAYVDFLIGEILEKLKEKNILKKTLIVIVGDHGESLGQHGENSHGFFIYDVCIQVPLIIYFPSFKLEGKQIASQVETVDIMPTLLQVLNLPVPPDVQGKMLIQMIIGEKVREEYFAYSESYYPLYHYGWSELKSLRSNRYKYIKAPRPELYDIINDPNEQNNIYKQKLTIAKDFQEKLLSLEKAGSAEGIEEKRPKKLDDETQEKLMALGYIGGFTSNSKLKKGDKRADPKDKIQLYNKIKIAQEKFAQKELDESLEKINQVIKEDPEVIEALQVRSRIYLELNKYEKAIADCKSALELDPEYEAVIFNMALAYSKQKKYDEAIAGYERLMGLDPRDHKPPFNLGKIYLEIKDLDKAISFLKQAINLQPEVSTMAHLNLGKAYFEKKKLELAEQEFRKSLEISPEISRAHFNLALVYEDKKEFRKAMEEYKKEIELHKEAYNAHFNLAKLYGKTGSIDLQIEHFKQSIQHKPDFANGYFFLAKAYLDSNKKLDDAINLIKKGLNLAPKSEYAPLGHYLLADIYNRLGQKDKYIEELKKGQELQKKLKKSGLR
jgi:arylsulfatase A-like enzyme/Tfp pilus assembly protein PilF